MPAPGVGGISFGPSTFVGDGAPASGDCGALFACCSSSDSDIVRAPAVLDLASADGDGCDSGVVSDRASGDPNREPAGESAPFGLPMRGPDPVGLPGVGML